MRTPSRRIARLLTGATYALLGLDALRSPGGRVDTAGPLLDTLRGVVPLPEDDELLVRANGGVQAAAGAALALGVLPRPAALALVGSMIPTTLAGHAFWAVEDPAARRMQQVQFLKNLAMIGGLIQVALDRGD
ncbi:DoxX family membrane protein [Nocardioides sp. L-11A]|uniref:DoxX family membrane protein n=1 Tax=Nocardioides sp. L-11A TaxID=3043848 RepID=UPI00249A7058|nr:DoxX family membrane protein [Nocardioides sp. L-11A]